MELTYMSIAEAASRLVAGGRLIDRPSGLLGIRARTVLVTPDIDAIARRPFADTLTGERHAAVAQFLDSFCELNEVTVAENPFCKPPDVMLARVAPVEEELWSMRITDPEETAGMRILGAFFAKDAFIGLSCQFRESISNFTGEVDDAREIWRDHFGLIAPYSGRRLDDYLTNYYQVG